MACGIVVNSEPCSEPGSQDVAHIIQIDALPKDGGHYDDTQYARQNTHKQHAAGVREGAQMVPMFDEPESFDACG